MDRIFYDGRWRKLQVTTRGKWKYEDYIIIKGKKIRVTYEDISASNKKWERHKLTMKLIAKSRKLRRQNV